MGLAASLSYMLSACFSTLLGMLDNLYSLTKLAGSSRPLFFSDGWGDMTQLKKVVEKVEKSVADGEPLCDVRDTLTWNEDSTRRHPTDGIISCRGSFLSPLAEYLPLEAQRCQFTFVSPSSRPTTPWSSDTSAQQQPQAVVLLLPATGEQGSSGRLRLAAILAEKFGFCSIVVTAPFYGWRRPATQRLHFLSRVDDFCYQSLAIMTEAAALLQFCQRLFPSAPLATSGFSWGAAMAGLSGVIAAQWVEESKRIAVIPYVGSATPAVIADGILASDIEWKAIAKPDETQEQTRVRLMKLLEEWFHLTAFQKPILASPEPKLVGAVRAVSMRDDKFVPPKYANELYQVLSTICLEGKHEQQWEAGGHGTAFLRRSRLQIDAIAAGVATLDAL